MNNSSTRKLFNFALGFTILVIIIPSFFYICQFSRNGLSYDSQDWSAFSDFISMWVSMASLILLATLTYVIYKNEEQRENQRYSDEKARNKPIIIFKVDSKKKVWYAKNVGNGVALNIYISNSLDKDKWMKPVKMYSLMAGEEFELFWFKPAFQICAVYNDVLSSDIIVSICEGDITKFSNLNPILKFLKDEEYIRLEDAENIDNTIKDVMNKWYPNS